MTDCGLSPHPHFVWNGPIHYCDSFSTVGRYLLQAMRRHGFPVVAHPRAFPGQKQLVDVHKELDGVNDRVPRGERSVTVSMVPPWEFPATAPKDSKDLFIPYTTLETDRLAEPSRSRIASSALKDRMWVPSSFVAQVVKESCDVATPRVIPHGVDIGRFAPLSQVIPPNRESVVFATVAACSPRKDFPSMVKEFRAAFEDFEDARLEIVTNTFFHRVPDVFLKECLRSVGIDIDNDLRTWTPKAFMGTTGFETISEPAVACIAIPSTTPHHAIASYLKGNIDVYVSTSKGEGFNLPALEAMACGKLTIMPDRGGHCDYFSEGVGYPVETAPASVDDKGLVRQGYTSWRQVVPERLRAAYRSAFVRAHEPMYARCIKARAVAERFSWDRVAEQACAAIREAGP